jgi:hypothetical protein
MEHLLKGRNVRWQSYASWAMSEVEHRDDRDN